MDFFSSAPASDGVREQKRRDTYTRIAESGLRLFLDHGYDETTLEMIADEVGIARRTFFSYFKSKDEIVLAWERAHWQAVLDEVLKTSPDEDPLPSVRVILDSVLSRSHDEHLKGLADLSKASYSLACSRHGSLAERESSLFAALCEVWRQPERRASLRLVAMVAMGTLRVAIERWEEGDNRLPLRRLYRQAFDDFDSLVA